MGGKGRPNKLNLNVLAGALVAVLAVLVAYLLAPAGQPEQPTPKETEQANPLEALARRVPGDPLAQGRPDAPVVLINYSDFRCPFCAKFNTDIEPELARRYVDSGVLRIEWRDFPIFGDESINAAKAGRAAARQGKFWEFQHAVFSQAPDNGHPPMPESRLIEFAQQAAVPDIERFRADLNDPATFAEIEKDATQASEIGVSSTPTFLVNGRPVMGAQPLEAFVEVIEQARNGAR